MSQMKDLEKPLTRDEFRNTALERDGGLCVLCKAKATEVHHIIERRLYGEMGNWGYFLSNAASVCNACHLMLEMTVISVETIRGKIGITSSTLPSSMYSDQTYDKWGNPVLASGKRLRGELFYDESVQKMLEKGKALNAFVSYVKYPRTHHLPWSPTITNDDRVLHDLSGFIGEPIIVTEKLDGENTTLYHDYIHARSLDYSSHNSRSWVRRFHAEKQYDIPVGFRVCGENVFAKHSIHYTNLNSFFYGFSIWDQDNYCLSWDETLTWFELLGITPVPLLYEGLFNSDSIRSLEKTIDFERQEGYVVRVRRAFSYGDFRRVVAKYVRSQHVSGETHWFFGKRLVENKLRREI